MRLALTFVRLRTEERLLLDAFETRGIPIDPIDLRSAVFDPAHPGDWARYDAVLDRSLSLTASLASVAILESHGIRCINPLDAIRTCSDKLMTTLALERAAVPTPGSRVAFAPESGLQAIERLGYPAVLKPTVGSWGRLIARVNDRDAAEAVLDHRDTLGSPMHGVVYAQEHVNKPQRDIRVFVVGAEAIAAITRTSAHWLTNTARGATAEGLEVSPELGDLAVRAVAAVGADLAAVDVLECPTRGLLVNEINHSMEFRNSITTTGVNIPDRMIDHVVRLAEGVRA